MQPPTETVCLRYSANNAPVKRFPTAQARSLIHRGEGPPEGWRRDIAYYDSHGVEQRESAGTKLDGRAARRLTVKELLHSYKAALEARGKESVDKLNNYIAQRAARRPGTITEEMIYLRAGLRLAHRGPAKSRP